MIRLFTRNIGKATNKKVVFLHVPKAGGSTFRKVLQQAYANSYHYFSGNSDVNLIKRCFRQYDCLAFHAEEVDGEMRFFHEKLLKEENWGYLEKIDIFIIFRNPVDCVISTYSQVKRLRNNGPIKRMYDRIGIAVPDTIEDFLQLPQHQNLQLSFLLGQNPFITGKFPDENDLKWAKRLLASLNFHIGITERYDEFLSRFRTVTGHKALPGSIEIVNRNPDPDAAMAISHDTHEMIRAVNVLDQELYEYASTMSERHAKNFWLPARFKWRVSSSTFADHE